MDRLTKEQEKIVDLLRAENLDMQLKVDSFAPLIKFIDNYAQQQVKNTVDLGDVVDSKPNEKAALEHAVSAIYFNDSSDYLSGLYGVVRSLTGLEEPSEEDISNLLKNLNP